MVGMLNLKQAATILKSECVKDNGCVGIGKDEIFCYMYDKQPKSFIPIMEWCGYKVNWEWMTGKPKAL